MNILKSDKNVKTDLFNFSFSRSMDELVNSIKLNGVSQLPYGISVNGSIQIYEGIQRYKIAQELGIKIDIIVKELSIREAFLEKMMLTTNKCNPIECALILSFADKYGISSDLFIKYIGINIENISIYLKLLSLPEAILIKTAKEPEFFKVAQLLLNKSKNDIYELFNLFLHYKLNINQAYECCQIIDELILKTKSFNISDLYQLEIKSSNSAQVLINHLKQIRYPDYMLLKTELNNNLKAINSRKVRFEYKDNFETDSLNLTASIKEPEDLEKIINDLKTNNIVITKLLSIIKLGAQ